MPNEFPIHNGLLTADLACAGFKLNDVGRLGVGTATPGHALHIAVPSGYAIYQDQAGASSYLAGQTLLGSSSTAALVFGTNCLLGGTKSGTWASTAAAGLEAVVENTVTSGTNSTQTAGVHAKATVSGAGTFSGTIGCAGVVGMAYGNTSASMTGWISGLAGYARKTGTGDIASASGLYVQLRNENATGVMTNAYGVYVQAPILTGAITNEWGIYVASTTAVNFFASPVVIGSGLPSSGSSIVTRRSITTGTGWGAAFVNSAARTTDGTVSGVACYSVANTTGLAANITGEDTAGLGVCASYMNAGHAVATRTVSLLQGCRVLTQHQTGAGAVTTMVGIDVSAEFSAASGTATAYLLRLRNRSGTNVTNYWGLYQEDSAARNFFAGGIGLGISTFPTVTGPLLAFGDVAAAPSTNPASGGVLYAEAGALKWRGSSGTITTIANA